MRNDYFTHCLPKISLPSSRALDAAYVNEKEKVCFRIDQRIGFVLPLWVEGFNRHEIDEQP